MVAQNRSLNVPKSAILAGAALAVPALSHAGAITISTEMYDTTGTGVSVPLDLFGDNNVEFTIDANLNTGVTITPAANAFYAGVAGAATPFTDPTLATMGPFINSPGGLIQKILSGSIKGPWPNDITAYRYLGIQFMDNGITYVGWLQISTQACTTCTIPAALSQGTQSSFSLPESGNFAGFSIIAGEADAVTPEPATISLFALGAAGLAVMRARRKRAQQ